MSRIAGTFAKLAEEGSGAFIPYVCAGDPDRGFTVDLVTTMCESGADLVELGIPFSDPVADGPVIQQAMVRSLSSGFRVAHIFEIIRELRGKGVEQPIVVMTYYNPVLRMGTKEFCSRLAQAGADGLLVVDLPPEESAELESAAASNGLDMIRLIAPNTTEARMRHILSKASGFVYVVSVAGTTGARKVLPSAASELLRRVSSSSKLPVALGFGVSQPEHALDAMKCGASGVVEGSKLISLYAESMDDRQLSLATVRKHVQEMKKATDRRRAK